MKRRKVYLPALYILLYILPGNELLNKGALSSMQGCCFSWTVQVGVTRCNIHHLPRNYILERSVFMNKGLWLIPVLPFGGLSTITDETIVDKKKPGCFLRNTPVELLGFD